MKAYASSHIMNSKTAACRQLPKIRAVRTYIQEGGDQGSDCHDVADGHWIDGPVACPMSVYGRFSASRKSWGINALGSLVVEVSDLKKNYFSAQQWQVSGFLTM